MKKYKHLDLAKRKQIERLYLKGESPVDIAKKIGVHTATVYNELHRGNTGTMDHNGRAGYSAELAQRNAYEMTCRRAHKSCRKERG